MRWHSKKPCITGLPEGEEWGKEAKSLFKEIVAENFPNLNRNLDKLIKLLSHPKISAQNDLL